MHDVSQARELLHDTFPVRPGRNVTSAIGEAYDKLKRRETRLSKEALELRPRRWTERRVKSLYGGKEARRVDHYEIEDLTAVAVEEARIERERLKAREHRLDALIAAQRASEAR